MATTKKSPMKKKCKKSQTRDLQTKRCRKKITPGPMKKKSGGTKKGMVRKTARKAYMKKSPKKSKSKSPKKSKSKSPKKSKSKSPKSKSLKPTAKDLTFYFVGMRKKSKVKACDVCVSMTKNKRLMLKAKCPASGYTAVKFQSNDDKERLMKTFGKCKK